MRSPEKLRNRPTHDSVIKYFKGVPFFITNSKNELITFFFTFSFYYLNIKLQILKTNILIFHFDAFMFT